MPLWAFSVSHVAGELYVKTGGCLLQIPGDRLPWSVVVKPTEPVLGPTRQLIKPVGGVDISPIIWVALLSFINEILLGPQGILNLLQRKIDLP
jgi:YggT family protein